MLLTAAQWDLRIKNEYEAMKAFPINTLFSWKIAPRQSPPKVMSYLVTYHVKTELPDGKYQNGTTVQITLPNASGGRPTATIVAGEIPFHPNIYINGDICIGDMWLREPSLWKLVINIGKLLAFDPAKTDPTSPANRDAVSHFEKNKSHYPCGRIDFPHPKGY